MAATDFNQFMSEFMKMFVNQRLQENQVQRWLNKSLQEYNAWEGHQRNVMDVAKQNQIIEDYLRNAFGVTQRFAGQQPNAPSVYNKTAREFLPSGMQGNLPEIEQPAIPTEEAQAAMAKLLGSLRTNELPDEATVGNVIGSYGLAPAKDIYTQVAKTKAETEKATKVSKLERDKLVMRQKELNQKTKADREEIKLGWAKLNQQINKINKGTATDKEKKDALSNYKTMITLYDGQIRLWKDELGKIVDIEGGEAEAKKIQEKINSLIKNKERLIKKAGELMGIQEEKKNLTLEERKKIFVERLVQRGVPREDAEKIANEKYGM